MKETDRNQRQADNSAKHDCRPHGRHGARLGKLEMRAVGGTLASDQPVGKDQKAEKADAKKEGHGPRTPMLSPEYREIEVRVQ